MDFYHVMNRGTDKRKVFLDNQDYARFQRNLYILNTSNQCANNEISMAAKMTKPQTDPLVHIHAFALMPNHYHLLLSPVAENGLSMFMKKINMGYSKYFNERNNRTGTLWQGKYKSVAILKDSQFEYIPYYIHLNPLDLSNSEWRDGKVSNFNKALDTLNNYKWCSHYHFMNPEMIKRSPVVNSLFINKFSKQAEYIKQIKKIVSTKQYGQESMKHEMK